MASSYALPPRGSHHAPPHSHSQSDGSSNSNSKSNTNSYGSRRGHAYSNSHNPSLLSPTRDTNSPSYFPSSNGALVKKAVSNGSLFTHKESSRETSPLASPYAEQPAAIDANVAAVNSNGHLHNHSLPDHHNHNHNHQQQHSHAHTHSHSHTNGQIHAHSHDHSHHDHDHSHLQPLMKGRPRGESDLGRPEALYASEMRGLSTSSPFSLAEALTSLLIPLPYLFASAAYWNGTHHEDGLPPLSSYARLQKSVLEEPQEPLTYEKAGSSFVEACTLASGTLMMVGIFAKIRSSERMLDRRKDKIESAPGISDLLTPNSVKKMVVRILGVGLPFYASTQLGGLRTGLISLVAVAAGLTQADTSKSDWKRILTARTGSMLIMLLAVCLDFAGVTFNASTVDLSLGYMTLACSLFLLPLPLPALAISSSSSEGAHSKSSNSSSRSSWIASAASSPLASSVSDVNITLGAGVGSLVLAMLFSVILSTSPPISFAAATFSTLAMATCAAAILFAQPFALYSPYRAGLGVGCFLIAIFAFLFSPSLWPGTVFNGGLAGLSYFGVLYDTSSATAHQHHEQHDHELAHNARTHSHSDGKYSFFTKLLIERCERGSMLYGILSEKDSRRIAYFTCLNFGFMFVQGVYGYISGSLGLLSDTVHMFFDCLGLIVGLGAAVASKWPTSPDKPYGWGKLNTLAGFGNGIFLMLVSIEFIWEAAEGIMEGKEIVHVQELFVVSTLGFLVNMVGLLAFGHAHAGHDNGHSHGHSHGHDHGHEHHSHEHSHDDHSHTHSHNPSTAGSLHGHDHGHSHASHSHSHDHHNENMHGIFLHVAADAGGSLAVIFSTGLNLWRPWYLWDPLAAIIIAVLIFAAAVPLVVSSGQKLLLVIPDALEYNIKSTLQELGELRGVVGYAAPRFWIDDKEAVEDAHDHHHHGHDHGPPKGGDRITGVIHIIAHPSADLDDVRFRVDEFFRDRNMNLTVHVEREGEGQCWCGGGPIATPRVS